MPMENVNFLLLQINDALFPIGGYSHSYGLETYIQKNMLNTEEEIRQYIDNRLEYGLKNTELLGAKLAYNYADKPEKLKELDEILTASKAPKEIRLASIKLGSRFIKTLKACSIRAKKDYFNKYIDLDYVGKHHCIAYGVVCAAIGVDLKTALDTYIYAQCSAMITNCVKTVPLSQSVGQKLLYESYELMEKIVEDIMLADETDFCLSTPAFDIRCMEHERLYSRLYMS
jgi:urease accessory protein